MPFLNKHLHQCNEKKLIGLFTHTFYFVTPEFAASRRHFYRRLQESSKKSSSSDPLGEVTPVLFLHRIAISVSPPNLIHLGISCMGWSAFAVGS